jgi:hypothetical protein
MTIKRENILHKNMISKDGDLIGSVTATSEDSIVVASRDESGHILHTYMILKSLVKGYHNGSELLLNMHFIIVDKFRVWI